MRAKRAGSSMQLTQSVKNINDFDTDAIYGRDRGMLEVGGSPSLSEATIL
jgi:hypothetical protein